MNQRLQRGVKMNNELLAVLEYLENERGIDREKLVSLVEESLVASARKSIGPANELQVTIDPKTGDIKAWAKLEVVETVNHPDAEISVEKARVKYPDVELGEKVDWEVTPENFGRIAAQAAKQAMLSRLRKAEKAQIAEEFSDQVGQLLSGVVTRVENRDVYIDFRRAEGVIYSQDTIPGEEYRAGDHVTVILKEVDEKSSGPGLIVSRADAELVRRLFEREVTEISEGLVKIHAVAREAGYRSKIAVSSEDPQVDPVGACVGLRGNRVKTVVRELGGEKVDIVPWTQDIGDFVANALQPAKLTSVEVDEENHLVCVKASEEQLSLAIGRKGQNARLAAKLTSWRIDIQKLEEEPKDLGFQDKIQQATERLAEIPGIGNDLAPRLVANGFLSVDGLLAADEADLSSIDEIDEEQAKQIKQAVREYAQ